MSNPTTTTLKATKYAASKRWFKPGTIVFLKSGSPPLTIAEPLYSFGVIVDVVWFDGAKLVRDLFHHDCLTTVPTPPGQPVPASDRQLAAHGDTADVRSKIAASIRAGCEDDVPVSDEEIGIIMGEATRLSKGD